MKLFLCALCFLLYALFLVRCKNCHSSLEWLDVLEALADDDHRCPKCGSPLDPREFRIDILGEHSPIQRRDMLVCAAIAIALAFVILWLTVVRNGMS